MSNTTLISPQIATVNTVNPVQLSTTKAVHLEVRNALTGRAQEIKSVCPVCGTRKGWCYILPGNLELGLYTQIICNRTPNPTKVEEAGLGEESLTIPMMRDGKFVYTNPKNEGSVPALVRIFKREVEVVTELKAKGLMPSPVEREKKIKEYKAQEAKKREQDTSTWLTEEEFNKQYWILARKFPLENHHKADLARRGFTEAQMKQYGFFSLYKGQFAPLGVSEYLPGFSRDYDTGRVKVANNLPQDGGYAVPYFNADGLVVGFQIRTSFEDRKYIWARGKNPSKLKRNEEDPISVLCKPEYPKVLLAMEGGLKAINCHEKLQLNAIAASGGHFHNGKDQVTDAINKYGITDFILCPDAGDTVNSHTRSRWTAEAQWLKATFPFLNIRFLWWGQSDKAKHQDIDEVSREFLAESQSLSIDEWLELVRSGISSFKDLVREIIKDAHTENAADEKSAGRGFGYNFIPQEIAGEDSYLWQPGMSPIIGFEPGAVERKPNPTVIFEREHHKDLLLAIAKQGGKVILNTSTMGSGKSMFTGDFDLEDTPWVKAFYISETHNNPTNDNIAQRFTNIAPRHSGGIQLAPGKFKYNVSEEEWEAAAPEDRVPANCSRVPEFNTYYSKGFSGEALEDSPCATCPHLNLCRAVEGEGYGYFAQKIKAFKKETKYVRCDIRQLPKDTNFKNAIFFVDESDKQFHATRSTTVDYQDFATQFSKILAESETVYDDLKWLHKGIHHLFHKAEGDMYGIDHDSVVAAFSDRIPDKAQLRTLIGAVTDILYPDFKKILETPDGVGGKETAATVGADKLVEKHGLHHIDWPKYIVSKFYRDKINPTFSEEQMRDVKKWHTWIAGGHYRRLKEANDQDRATRNYFLAEVAEKNLEILNSLTGLGVLHLLEYFYSRKGALRIEEGGEKGRKLIVTLPQLRYVESLKRADTVVLFDATMDIRTTKQIFQLPEVAVYHVQEQLPSYDNLEVISVNIHGVGSSLITDCAKERLNAAVAEIKKREPENTVEVIGRKKDGDTYYLFNHNRGSNVFFEKGIKTLIIKGTPWVHVGAMLDEFRTLHGDCQDPKDENAFHRKFNEFYFHKVGAEIQQACGRLRHQWRPGEKLKIYLLTSKLDLSFLHKRYGVKIKHMEGFELTPFAGTKAQCLIFRALGIAKTLFDKSGKTKLPNQQAIADLLGITQGRVSQIAEEYLARGWADFRRILLGSLSDPYREINKNERSSDQESPKGDLDPDQVYFQEEIYKSRGDRGSRSECWVPEVFDASIPFIGLAGLLEDSQEEDLRLLGKELHPYEQAEMIAHVFAHSSSGMESRSSKYGISYSEIQPFVDLIWGEGSWFTKPDWLIEAEETAIA